VGRPREEEPGRSDKAAPGDQAGPGNEAGPQGEAELRAEVAEAARVLAALGLVTAFGHVSARLGEAMLITPGADLTDVTDDRLVTVPFETSKDKLPPGAPAEAWAHLALYQRRAGVDAIARAQPPSAFAAAAAAGEDGAIWPLYGQAAWLGERVPVHDDARLLRSPELAAAAAASLPDGEALLLRGNGALTLGATPGLAVARMWLLAASCQAFLDARGTGTATRLRPAETASFRAVAGELLPRLWQHLRGRAQRYPPQYDGPRGPTKVTEREPS
jgi:HCOMODA/2-hydroxy-3-carboxy-muconic semialdehyde decarboxylase